MAEDRSRLVPGLLFLVTLAFFWPTVASFPATWARYGMNHGWLIAGLVGWLLWKHRRDFAEGRGGDSLLLIPLAGLSLLWFAATVAHVQVVHQFTLLLVMMCAGLVVFGRRSVTTIFVLGATFLLALPFWEALVPPLRRLTTLASGGLVKLLGIVVQIEGDVIHISAGTFLVDEGCAGLNYLVAGLVVGVFYAHVLLKDLPAKVAVVAMTAVMAILGNWIRVFLLIVIGHVTNMESGLMESHSTFGWMIFTIGLIPFFFGARFVEKRMSRTRGGMEKGVATAPEEGLRVHASSLEALNFSTPEPEAAAPWDPERRRSLIRRSALAGGVAVIGPVLYLIFGALPAAEAEGLELVDMVVSERWSAVEAPGPRPFDWQPGYFGADQHDTQVFTDGTTEIYGDRFVYREQGQGAKLVGYPNQIAAGGDIISQRVTGPVDPSGRRWVRQAIISTPEGPILTLYWFRVGGVESFSPIHAKILEIPAFLRRQRDAELFAFSAPCDPESCRGAFEAVAGFMGARLPEAPDPPA